MHPALLAFSAAVLMAGLTACSGESGSSGVASGDASSEAAESCPVTQPSEEAVRHGIQGFNYGNDALYVALWPDGTLVAGPLPDSGSFATINPDGSIHAKLGWWRAVEGDLRIEGERLDADAPALRAQVPIGYGDTGFQATGLVFPSTGCWRVVGTIADSHLSFVVRVVKNDEVP